MRVLLETERLILRRFTEADAENLLTLDGDPEVMRFITGGRPAPREEIRTETLPRFLRAYGRFEGFGVWAAVERSGGGFVGWFEFFPPEGSGPEEAELGYRLRRSAWGKGYATEGSRALVRKGFAELGVRRVVAQTMAVNRASRRVMEKAGLTHARTFYPDWADPIAGAEKGEVEYVLTREEWERREAAGRERSRDGSGPGRPGRWMPSDAREEWDRVFSSLGEALDGEAPGGEDAWLEGWLGLLTPRLGRPVLDLGCGAGEDTRYLSRRGFRVVAADFSEKALELTGRRAPGARTVRADLTRGLPFPDGHFGAIVASLSLHYFPWSETVEILDEVRRCLVPGGHLLARLNSTNDAYHAAARKEPIGPNYYLVGGSPKRHFSREDVGALLSPSWTLEHAGEQATYRYGRRKTLWEIVATKPENRGRTPKGGA